MKKLSWQMLFAAFLAIFFLRNLLMPVVADDYSYSFIWDGDGLGNMLDSIDTSRLQRVDSISDILYSQWQHYFTWGGRTVAHILVQMFAWLGKGFFDVANVLVFAALVMLLFKLGTGLPLRDMNKSYLLLILAGMYFCTPTPLITTIWMTGSINYLWMSTLELLFLLPFVMSYRKQKPLRPTHCALFLIAFLAGWSSEPGAAVTIFITLVFIVKEKSPPAWMKSSLIFLLIGFALMILAPGNFHRSELIGASLNLASNFNEGFLPVFLREIILFAPIIVYFAKARTSPAVTRFILTFVTASVLSLAVMMCSPIFPERAGFPSTIFLLVASLAALKEILPLVKVPIKIVTIFATVWLMSLIGCLYVEYSFHSQLETRKQIIAAHVNDDLIKVPPIELPTWSEFLLGSRTWDKLTLILGGDLSSADFNNRNLTFARYHGLKRIVTKDTP